MGPPCQQGGPIFFASKVGFLLLTATLLTVICLLYQLAFAFGISFDDSWNLSGLSNVNDSRSALEFVFGGAAGPTGRPLALLSFVPSAYSWPTSPDDFLFQNLCIHLINVMLVMWLALRLVRYLPWSINRPEHLALLAAALWGLNPLLFSTSMMIVQRMNTLGALFSLAGLLCYVVGRQILAEKFRRGLVLMSTGLGGGTLLAMLCKENGVLLPGYALILEVVLIRHGSTTDWTGSRERLMGAWRGVFLYLPATAIFLYLGVQFNEFQVQSTWREFSVSERLMTEARILFDYLRLLIFPIRSHLGPYHDNYLVSRGLFDPVSTLLAVTGLAIALVFAWRARKGRFRLVTLATLWFLWGHVLESTIIPLELYFEHRNYLPSVGVMFVLAALLLHPSLVTVAKATLAGMLLINSTFVLRETALLWGDPLVAAAVWHHERPASLRSLQLYVLKLWQDRRGEQLLATVDAVQAPLADTTEYAMVRLATYCDLRSAVEVKAAAQTAIARMPTGPFTKVVTEAIDNLAEKQKIGECKGITSDLVVAMLDNLLSNPHPAIRNDTKAQAHEIYARLMIYERNLDLTMYHLEAAFVLRPTLSTGIAMASILTSAQLFDAARSKLDALAPLAPSRPLIGDRWRKTVVEMREIIDTEQAAVVAK